MPYHNHRRSKCVAKVQLHTDKSPQLWFMQWKPKAWHRPYQPPQPKFILDTTSKPLPKHHTLLRTLQDPTNPRIPPLYKLHKSHHGQAKEGLKAPRRKEEGTPPHHLPVPLLQSRQIGRRQDGQERRSRLYQLQSMRPRLEYRYKL